MSTVLQLRPALGHVRIALAGCGTVNSALIRLLRERAPAIAREQGVHFETVGVLVRDLRRPRLIESAAGVLTNRAADLYALNADVVIEATGAADTALELARHTLARGARFITANKALIAAHGAALAALAHTHGGRLHFEAAVGGGVPVIRALRQSLRHSGTTRVRGILNGTSNYVLTRMQQGEDLETALYAARMHGFAEADATRDLDGRDAAAKIAILAWLAFGIDPAAVEVQRTSLLPHVQLYLDMARVHGGVLRQLAECHRDERGVSAVVAPVIAAHTSPMADVCGEDNAVEIATARNGVQWLRGPGAGGNPTALSLLSDLLDATPEPGVRTKALRACADGTRRAWALGVPGGNVADVLGACDRAGLDLEWIRSERGTVHARTALAERACVAATGYVCAALV